MTVIVDSSVAAKWFLKEELHEKALGLLDDADRLQAPDLIVAEVSNVAWKKVVRSQISVFQAKAIGKAIQYTLAVLHPSTRFADRALELALALRHPVYDCIYLACAESQSALLISADKKLCGVVQGTEFQSLVQPLETMDIPP